MIAVDSPRLLARDLDSENQDHYDPQSEATMSHHRYLLQECRPHSGRHFFLQDFSKKEAR
jgi:hypothetical protein